MKVPLTSMGAWDRIRRRSVRLRLICEIALWRYGWLWLITGLLLVMTAGGAVFCGLTAQREAAELARDKQALVSLQIESDRRAALAQSGTSPVQPPASPDADKQGLLAAVLPPREQASDELRRLYGLADQEQIVISQAEFQTAGGGGIERLQVRIPAKASYPKLRRFLEATLLALPNASLDRLSFTRNQVANPQIEAQVYLSLWFDVPTVKAGVPGGDPEARP